MSLDADDILKVLRAEKRLVSRAKYKNKGHRDYCEAVTPVLCAEFPEANIRFISNYHVSRIPRKYTFVLLIQEKRSLALDVAPGRTHFNPITGEIVRTTHWQIIPDLNSARPDHRELSHWEWYKEFMSVANIEFDNQYIAPSFTDGYKQAELWDFNDE